MKIINHSPIAILMATYNGEQYLAEQIESIRSQSNAAWTLYIQDDGSTDTTRKIIRSYMEKDKRIHLVDVGLTNQGACVNFMSLLNIIESQYYMFADQDDVWLSHKVEVSIDRLKMLENNYPNIPILVGTDKSRTDESLNIIHKSELNRLNISHDRLKELLRTRCDIELLRLICPIAGCTMAFNHLAKEVAFPYNNSRYQDSIIAMAVAKNYGIIDTILEPTMLYRRHNSNTSDLGETNRLQKLKQLGRFIDGQIQMYLLYKLYGGGGFLKFMKARIRLYQNRGF